MLGHRLKRVRQDRGYTQEQLAEMVGINLKQVGRHENGETKPDGEIVARYAQALEVSTDYLLGVSDDPNPDVQIGDLSREERAIIASLRRGERMEAIKNHSKRRKSPQRGVGRDFMRVSPRGAAILFILSFLIIALINQLYGAIMLYIAVPVVFFGFFIFLTSKLRRKK